MQALAPASVAAFGPAGTADGDHPEQAALAVSGDPATPWNSDWYATADFGDLQAGTGLLLDMGQPVTISSVRLSLGGSSGADLQLRAGSAPVLADLHTVATSAGAGGTVQLVPDLAGARPLPAHLVHPAAARQRRHLPGQRLRHYGPRQALKSALSDLPSTHEP